MSKFDKKVWLVELPAHQYKEDVKALSKEKNLRVIDARFADQVDEGFIAKDVPKLTKKPKAKTENAKIKASAKTEAEKPE